jgi:hypothetical protein
LLLGFLFSGHRRSLPPVLLCPKQLAQKTRYRDAVALNQSAIRAGRMALGSALRTTAEVHSGSATATVPDLS